MSGRPDRRRYNPARRTIGALAAGLFLIGGLGACGSDGDLSLPDVSLPDVSLPDVSLPSVSLPGGGSDSGGGGDSGGGADSGGDSNSGDGSAGSTGSTDSGDGSDGGGTTATTPTDDGLDAGAITATILILIAAAALIAWLASRGGRDEQAAVDRRAGLQRQIDDVVNVARWADNQTAQLLAASQPAQLASVEATLTSHLVDAETNTARLAGSVDDDQLSAALSELGRDFAALRGALAAFLTAATTADGDVGKGSATRQALDSSRSDLDLAARRVSVHAPGG